MRQPRQDEDGAVRAGAPKREAAGIPAVAYALKLSLQQMGPSRTARTLARVNQHDGFDCPGCGWPDPASPHLAEFCENGAKAVAEEATTKRVGPAFFARHAVAELAEQTDHWLGRQGRLTHPMHLAPGATHYAPITWERAFALIAEELDRLESPDEAIFYTSGRTSNEAAFAYQLLVRAFGTNNLPDCSNMCHEASGAALTETIGISKGSVSLEDIHAADLILVVGQNPGTNHPRMLTALEQAKDAGARIVAVNPLPEAGLMRFNNPQTPRGMAGRGTVLADLFLQVRVNGDLALFKALNRCLLDRERTAPGTVLDRDFLAAQCVGLPELEAELDALDWAAVARAGGIDRAQIEQLADLVAGADRVIVCWAMGLTQHKNSVATIKEIVNTLLLTGNIGRRGAGLCPVRGHSNVQGDRTMGIYEKPDAAFLDALQETFGFAPPREDGHDTVAAIRAMRDGEAKVFVAMGGNFATATPDTEATFAALRGTRLTVQVSTKLNRSHVVTGEQALILPTLGRTERDMQRSGAQQVTVEDSMSVVHASRGRLAPAGDQLRSEVAIVCALAGAVLGDRAPGIPWAAFAEDYALIRDRIADVVPGFEDFNARIEQPGGFVLPHLPRDTRTFATPSGKAHLSVTELTMVEVPPGRLLLQTLRSHDQYNTTIYGLNDRYRGIRAGRRVVMVSPEDLAALGHADGDLVDLVGEWSDGVVRRCERFRVVAYPTARGCAAAYYPETNALVPLDSVGDTSGTPTSKSIVIRLEPHAA